MTNFFEALEQFNSIPADIHCEVEHRLYYDANGQPLFYSTEELNGKYIVVSKAEHTQGRYDITIQNGKVVYPTEYIYQKLVPNEEGTECDINDVSIIGNGQKWSIKQYE